MYKRQPVSASLPPFCLDEEQSEGRPYQFADSHYQCHEDTAACRHGEPSSRHHEAPFPAAELQWDEEEQIGEERREGEHQDARYIVHVGREHEQDEHQFEARKEAAQQLQVLRT